MRIILSALILLFGSYANSQEVATLCTQNHTSNQHLVWVYPSCKKIPLDKLSEILGATEALEEWRARSTDPITEVYEYTLAVVNHEDHDLEVHLGGWHYDFSVFPILTAGFSIKLKACSQKVMSYIAPGRPTSDSVDFVIGGVSRGRWRIHASSAAQVVIASERLSQPTRNETGPVTSEFWKFSPC